jgi:hypothetical protein
MLAKMKCWGQDASFWQRSPHPRACAARSIKHPSCLNSERLTSGYLAAEQFAASITGVQFMAPFM